MKVSKCNDKNLLFSYRAFEIYSACMYDSFYEEYKLKITKYLDDKFIKIFSCTDHRNLIGLIVLDCSNIVAEIVGIAVSKKNRNQGTGKFMLYRVVKLAHLKKVKAQTDEASIEFYRKCGFVEKQEIIKYPDCVSTRYNCFLSI